jgi:DNA/RNA-binding domain of Phe-tRNA-synthetase-like protein
MIYAKAVETMTRVPPSLLLRCFRTRFARPLAELTSDAALLSLLSPRDAQELRTHELPEPADDGVRKAVRDMLRHHGYKPTGRGKPASEYLVRAAAEGQLPRINLAVDACNAASLHSGLPISVIDLDCLAGTPYVAAADSGTSYVFNASGQSIDISHLVCLHDAEGPCANPVKDAQRTKTSGATTRTLSVIWGVRELEPRVERTLAFYRRVLERAGATTEPEELLP